MLRNGKLQDHQEYWIQNVESILAYYLEKINEIQSTITRHNVNENYFNSSFGLRRDVIKNV